MFELNNDWLKTRTYYSFFLQINNFTLKKFVMKKFKTIFAKLIGRICLVSKNARIKPKL